MYHGVFVECRVLFQKKSVVLLRLNGSREITEEELPVDCYAYRFGRGTVEDGVIKTVKQIDGNFTYRGTVYTLEQMREKGYSHSVIEDIEEGLGTHALLFNGYWKVIRL